MDTKKIIIGLYVIICSTNVINIILNSLMAYKAEGVFTRTSGVNNAIANGAMFPLFIFFARMLMKSEDDIKKEKYEIKKEDGIEMEKSSVSVNISKLSQFSRSNWKNSSNEKLKNIAPPSPSISPIPL